MSGLSSLWSIVVTNTYTEKMNKNQQLLKQMVKTRKNLQRKYNTLKSDILKSQTHLEKSLHPITKPLKQLITKMEKREEEIILPKMEIQPEKQDLSPVKNLIQEELEKLITLYQQQQQEQAAAADTSNQDSFKETIYQTSDNEDNTLPEPDATSQYIDESIRQFSNITSDENTVFQSYLEDFHPLPRIYVKENIQDSNNQFDHRFGVYHNIETDKFSIGDADVTFEGPDLRIKGVLYKGTPGLYELLFKNTPLGFNKSDEKEYNDILKRTNALHVKHDPNNPLQRTTKETKNKFERVIAPNLSRPRRGSAPTIRTRSMMKKQGGKLTLMNFKKSPIDYIYFDDYNEIVDRLRLLLASESAGNQGHRNEIISIIEELREARIIK